MKNIYVILLLLPMFSLCCKTKPKGDTLLQENTVKRDIPLTKKGRPDFFYKLNTYQASILKLDSLEIGYDSLQIRIWCNYGLLDVRNVIVIKRNNELWNAELLTVIFDENDSSYMRKPILKERINKIPTSGWSSFINKLVELNVTQLPDQSKVSGYKDILGADGVTYNVEVATMSQYRFYSYWQPNIYKGKYKEAKNIDQILELIEKELSFKRLQ
jgi:hypothetical protein